VYSIRQNLNAFGTEHSGVDDENRATSQWVVPPGVKNVPYTQQEDSNYKKWVTQQYYDLFASDFLVFVRTTLLNDASANIPQVVLRAIDEGRVGLVHTSSQPEPASASTERKYVLHEQYGRKGITPIYAEPYSGSDAGPQPPAQWNYWRILSDLHVGVSYVAVYGSDIEQYTDPEFDAAFEFANRYAGYQAPDKAASSPGAWIALREGDKFLKGDYSFLMTRTSGDANAALDSAGPKWQRYGAWARRINNGGRMRFELDDRFAGSLGSGQAYVRIVFLDSGTVSFAVDTPGGSFNVRGNGKGTWVTKEVAVPASAFSGSSGADITLQANSDVVVHMVEVTREDIGDGDLVAAPPKAPNLIQVN
jgi:hypothetical protein